ncbi:TPA: ATP-binding protein [Citrobacter freundii]|nr:AAA family ATPase [Citrobacter freundii]HBU6168909.1 ATP-binding protein [Citrobacter freundii]HBV8021135.1 ATP-binding protein [Citrobacter freundii]HEG1872475.1 ATP-binding protein [Citrobacter freundii]
MIFTRMKFTNLCAFTDAELNLSYPRQLTNSPLEGEFLHGRPKFYFRKVCLVTGANASGKTSLGRMIWGMQSFLFYKTLRYDTFPINDKSKYASFEADFVTDDFHHHRIFVKFKEEKAGTHTINEVKYSSVFIGENDTCSKTTKKLDKIFLDPENTKKNSYFFSIAMDGYPASIEFFKKYEFNTGWYYLLSETKETTDELSEINKDTLELIIKTFDPSIKSVSELKEVQELDGKKEEIVSGYSIRFYNNDNVIVTKSGEVANYNRLSRGTFDAVKLSLFVSAIQSDYMDCVSDGNYTGMVYFLDERMAYVHSELERAIITLIISKLPYNSQFFYTTHNCDIFKLDLPIHSFIFLKKENDRTTFVDASATLKKNDRNLSRYVENDIFGVLPDLSLIEALI